MSKKLKKEVLKRLVRRGAVECATVCANDWGMQKYLEKIMR